MTNHLKFDTYLNKSSTRSHYENSDNVNLNFVPSPIGVRDGSKIEQPHSWATAPVLFTTLSTVSTLALLYVISKGLKSGGGGNDTFGESRGRSRSSGGRSTPLPGYGLLGDQVNEFFELFLDALAVYVHNDQKWECQRRMLCEANQRATDYGLFQGVVMYFLSLGVSLFLQNQRVSDSLEAMKFGRRGNDCTQLYPKCPFSL